MSHYKAPDHKREQFRRYLEKAGVVDSLTSVLVALYEQPEKPTNALEFVKQHLGTPGGLTAADTAALQQEVVDLRQKCARLEEENQELKARLQCDEQPDESAAPATE
ncbi:c-Myc-binding protein-like [Corythoichthys intestinalis]|uniref:c-Myc-binding protein-like n=1 Tax=Corythoichthys intestinalis TaxID=161448 RepID=UPI0025A5FD72|nr:c-Myc-binding protein-like [Corythoichthys intestinalis]XP_057689298.1 c-Myc-binding protein-like [Corythoichthys intestinalis]XP_061789124.1 c-Myc-binding protein-like [Nerophis lumbriciformis]